MDIPFPFKVEMVELKGDAGWAVKAYINTKTVQEAHQIAETLASFLDEMNALNKEEGS